MRNDEHAEGVVQFRSGSLFLWTRIQRGRRVHFEQEVWVSCRALAARLKRPYTSVIALFDRGLLPGARIKIDRNSHLIFPLGRAVRAYRALRRTKGGHLRARAQ